MKLEVIGGGGDLLNFETYILGFTVLIPFSLATVDFAL